MGVENKRFVLPLLVVASLLAAVTMVAACGSAKSGAGAAATTTVQRGGNVTIARNEDILSLDPTAISDNASVWSSEQLYETMYTLTPDGKSLKPELATGYTVSANKLVWTFTLRPGAKFSDGTPLTAKDVAFSMNRARLSTAGIGYIDSAMRKVTAPNATTVVIYAKHPWAPMLADVALFVNGVMPANFGGKTEAQFFQHPLGSGPFMFGAWTKGASLRLDRNPNYWETGKPYLDSVTYTNVPEDATRSLQMQGGQIQVDALPAWSFISAFKAMPGVKVQLYPSSRTDVLLLNERVAPYQDVHVRRAISDVLNRADLVTALLFGNGQAANSYLPPSIPYYDAALPTPKYDLAKAKQEMAASSVPSGFTTTFLTDNLAVDVEEAQIVQQALRSIGITVKIRTVDADQEWTIQGKGDYQITGEYWSMDIPDPDESTEFFLSPTGGSNCYFTYYDSATMTKLVASSAAAFDPTKRAGIYDQIQTLDMQDLPQIPLFFSPWAYVVSTKVHDFTVYSLGSQDLTDTWVTK
jgi:peptide/nickel transport system substrate-binding protein